MKKFISNLFENFNFGYFLFGANALLFADACINQFLPTLIIQSAGFLLVGFITLINFKKGNYA